MIDKKELSLRMEKSVESLKKDLAKIRAGVVSPSMLDKVKVDYYGTPTAITHVATISVPEPRTLVIQPYEKPLLKEIEKALFASDLGVTPTADGNVIRLNFPVLTTERREDLAKRARSMAEESRVSIRNIRRDENDLLKKVAKDKNLPEDEVKGQRDTIQQLTDQYIDKIDVILKQKENDIMSV